jgi:hypothetical protein
MTDLDAGCAFCLGVSERQATRIYLKRNRETRRVVVAGILAHPHIGESVSVDGEAEKWTVTKTEPTSILFHVRMPRRKPR